MQLSNATQQNGLLREQASIATAQKDAQLAQATDTPFIRAMVTGTAAFEGYTEDTFGDTERRAFAAALAKLLNVSPEYVAVTVVSAGAGRRRLLAAVAVTYEVTVADVATAMDLQATIEDVSQARRCRLTL